MLCISLFVVHCTEEFKKVVIKNGAGGFVVNEIIGFETRVFFSSIINTELVSGIPDFYGVAREDAA